MIDGVGAIGMIHGSLVVFSEYPNQKRGATMRNAQREAEASRAASYVRERLRRSDQRIPERPIGLVLGTGWGDVLAVDSAVEIPFGDIPGFEGHARRLVIGTIAGRDVAVLRGRVHLNEAPYDPNVAKMVRLQTEMLLQLGVQTLIVTSAVGALRGALAVGGKLRSWTDSSPSTRRTCRCGRASSFRRRTRSTPCFGRPRTRRVANS